MEEKPVLNAGLDRYNLVAFVPIIDAERAKSFYRDTLGLRLLTEELPFALVFDVQGIMLRLSIYKELPVNPGTVLGWQVPDIGDAVQSLARAGVRFERYAFLEQDESGVWHTPTGAKVAWFKDSEGNLLSISQH